MCKVSSINNDEAMTSQPEKVNEMALQRIASAFPEAVTNAELVADVTMLLEKHGFDENTLLATSLCCDGANRVLEREFDTVYDNHFSMGGLAGFPFGGVTSFSAMAHQIADGASCLIVYGPHVGIDSNGVVGTAERQGCKSNGPCCGSATDAANYVGNVKGGSLKASAPTKNALGVLYKVQQSLVRSMLLPYQKRLSRADDAAVELPLVLFEAVDDMMKQVVSLGAEEVAGEGKIALLGGIQINTPDGLEDYFLPLNFEVRNNQNCLIEDLMKSKY